MSITSDIRTYADTAVQQGKQVLDTAQAQLNDVRASAEKAVNIDALSSAVEPYVAQFKEYASVVTDKVEELVSGVLSDKRVALVVETVQQRVVQPVQDLTGRGTRTVSKPAARPSPKPTRSAAKPARKPAATRSSTAPAGKPASSKPAARTAPTKRAATS
jgi:hypothetical protein